MITHDVQQGTEAWLKLRCGIPTASEFDNLVTPEWKPRTGQTPETYLLKKVAERALGAPLLSYASGAMEQGNLLEAEAVSWFEFAHSMTVQRPGFCTTDDGRIGCSPDGLIGEDGGLEIKCPEPHTHLKYLLAGAVPKDYLAQVQGNMLVTGRAWWIFVSYNRAFPALAVKIMRDEAAQKALQDALGTFLGSLGAACARLKQLTPTENAPAST